MLSRSRGNMAVKRRASSSTVPFTFRRTSPSVVRLSNRITRMTRRAMSTRYIDSCSPWWKSELNSVSPMRRASWSFALKSAAVRVAKEVASKRGCSPTVATSCPERSTSIAHRALLSYKNCWSDRMIAPRSSSVNDQLAAPTGIEGPSDEGLFHLAQETLATTAQLGTRFAGYVVTQQHHVLGTRRPTDVPQSRQTAPGARAEQVVPVTVGLLSPDD